VLLTHTVQPLDTPCPHCVRDVLCCPCSLAGCFPPPPPQPVHRSCSAASQVLPARLSSRAVHLRRVALAFLSGPLVIDQTGEHETSRFSRKETPRMPGSQTRGVRQQLAIALLTMCFRFYDSVGTPDRHSGLNSPAYVYPCQCFACASRTPTHDSGSSWSLPFDVERSHSLLSAGLSRRTVDGVQHLDHGRWRTCPQRGDAERRLRPSDFGMYTFVMGLPVGAAVDPCQKVGEIRLQILAVVIPGHLVHALAAWLIAQ